MSGTVEFEGSGAPRAGSYYLEGFMPYSRRSIAEVIAIPGLLTAMRSQLTVAVAKMRARFAR